MDNLLGNKSSPITRVSVVQKVIFTFLLIALTGQVFSDERLQSLENLSGELVKIRQDIGQLHDEINFEKSRYNDRVRAFANQQSDLEVKNSRAELNIKDLERELDKLLEENRQKRAAYDEVTPVLQAAITELRQTVAQSLPFKRQDRLDALDEITHKLNTSLITPNKAANQLWAFVEDELILGRSSGLYNESLQVEGDNKLVKVLRIGKLAMFYKTQDNQYGVLRKVSGEWQQESLDGKTTSSQLDYLFDSFNKNIRNGLFNVPNYLPQG
tara:strand:+ start:217 stop:1026 length:810 start_codon:yes stop_codon:yes gene_type:complete